MTAGCRAGGEEAREAVRPVFQARCAAPRRAAPRYVQGRQPAARERQNGRTPLSHLAHPAADKYLDGVGFRAGRGEVRHDRAGRPCPDLKLGGVVVPEQDGAIRGRLHHALQGGRGAGGGGSATGRGRRRRSFLFLSARAAATRQRRCVGVGSTAAGRQAGRQAPHFAPHRGWAGLGWLCGSLRTRLPLLLPDKAKLV